MKLYHIDRSGHLKEGQIIDYIKDVTLIKDNLKKGQEEYINDRYTSGLSSHGLRYYISEHCSKSYALDMCFEYERLLNYPNKLSRYESLYAFDINGVLDFINDKGLYHEFFKIYEVEYNYYEVHNMSLIRGFSHYEMALNSKLYWENKSDYNKNIKEVNEYLLKLPITIKKEIPFSYFIENSKNNEK